MTETEGGFEKIPHDVSSIEVGIEIEDLNRFRPA